MFTEIDVLVCVILMISVLSAFIHGFLKNFFALLTWIGASWFTLSFFPYMRTLTEEVFKNSMLMNLGAVVGLFMATMLLLALISSTILASLRDFRRGVVDRTVGVAFGAAKGLAIVSTMHLCVTLISAKDPEWLTQGQTYPLTQSGSIYVRNVMGNLLAPMPEENPNETKEIVPEDAPFDAPSPPASEPAFIQPDAS